MKKVTIADVQAFDNESFLEHYSTLIDVAMESGREDAVMETLSFINDLKRLIEDLKADMAAEQDDTQKRSEKEKKLIDENLDLHRENQDLREKLMEHINKETGNQTDPAKMKVSK